MNKKTNEPTVEVQETALNPINGGATAPVASEEATEVSPKLLKKQEERNKRALRKMASVGEVLEIVENSRSQVWSETMTLGLQIQTLATVLIEKGITTEEELEKVSQGILNNLRGENVNPDAKTDNI